MTEDEQKKYDEALAYATEKHSGQKRKGGLPYITHPVAVAEFVREKGYGIDYQITGLFHDLLEDTDAEESKIEEIGGPEVLEAVKLLTKTEGYVMETYVSGIKANPMARAVKAADRLHNLISAHVTDENFKRRYILETLDWYMDLSEEIPKAVKSLADSLEKPMTELSFMYQPVDNWLENNEDNINEKENA